MSARKIKRTVMQRRRVVARWLPAGRWVKIRKARLRRAKWGVDLGSPDIGVIESFRFVTSGSLKALDSPYMLTAYSPS